MKFLLVFRGFIKRKPTLFLLLLLGVLFTLYFDGVLDKEPMNMHVWRQTDCLSLTRNYANGANFCEPQLDILLADDFTSGKSAGEFPILYFIVGKFWSWFGESILFYRLFYLFIMVGGLIAYFKILLSFKVHIFIAYVLTLLLATSPVFLIYGVSFLTDVPALCFVLIGMCFFINYQKTKFTKHLITAFLFFALAGLIKISSLILFINLGALFLLELFGVRLWKREKLFPKPIYVAFGFCFVLISIFSWYYYAKLFNDEHNFKYTFNNIYPLWIMDKNSYLNFFTNIRLYILPIFISHISLWFTVIAFTINLFLIKRIPLMLYLSNIIVFCGTVLYFLLWAPLFENHDYYWIPILSTVLMTWTSFAIYLKTLENNRIWFNLSSVLFIVFLVFNIGYAYDMVGLKTKAASGNFVFVHHSELKKYMTWLNYDIDANKWRYKRIQNELLASGVNLSDKVICLSDPSFSISLYFLNRKGWTNFIDIQRPEQIDELISKGAKYLLIENEDSKQNLSFIQPFLKNQIGEFERIKVFKLEETNSVDIESELR